MIRKLTLTLALVAGGLAMTGCAPLVLGAGAAVVVDEAAEREGGNLF